MLHVHRAERADRLADGLAATLLEPLNDPFAPEIVAVPTRGIERWLTQRLSTRSATTGDRSDGVCANVEFPFPARLIQGALAAATGIDPDSDPWLAERSVWPLLEVVDECLGEPWLATLARHLEGARGDPEDPMRRFGAVRHIAELFDRYAVQRPDLVRAGSAAIKPVTGSPSCGGACANGSAPRARPSASKPACERIREDPGLLELPARLSLFGLTRIPRSHLDAAGGDRRPARRAPVRAPPVAGAMETGRRADLRHGRPIERRHDDRTATAPINRLLASWGRDVRELQLVLANAGRVAPTATTRCRRPNRRRCSRRSRPTSASRQPLDRPAGGPIARPGRP